MLVEVLDPIEACFIGGLAIIGGLDHPFGGKIALGVPVRQMVLTGEDDERRDGPGLSIDALNHRGPLPVARLGQFGLPTTFRGRHTIPAKMMPIIKPVSSKLQVSSSNIPYLALVFRTSASHLLIAL